MTKTAISFNASAADSQLITKIVMRAASLLGGRERLELAMDITAVHMNGCPLKLGDLLMASDFDFCHDIKGIQAHLNRSTGKLEHYFTPRFATTEGR